MFRVSKVTVATLVPQDPVGQMEMMGCQAEM